MNRWIAKTSFFLTLATLTLAPLADADAALSANLKLKGSKQGELRGGSTDKGRTGTIEVESIAHDFVSPRDASTGQPTGKRQHKPFVITKPVDRASPMLYAALADNENLIEWRLDVFMPSPKGGEALAYSIKLTNATVAKVQLITDEAGNLHEVVEFTYQKIEWTWSSGAKVSASDTWSTGTP